MPRESVWRAPLSRKTLREIWRRNRNDDVRTLLWEIARLHQIVKRADVILRLTYGQQPGVLGNLVEELREILKAEPSLEEDRAGSERLFDGTAAPRRAKPWR